jgi:hypothetical protein
MKTINGGTAVKGGYYLSKSNWEVFPVANDGEKLPGAASEHYVHVPTAAALALLPVLGGLMVVFLPFIGIYLTAKAVARPVAGMFGRSAQDLGATITPGWAPGAAHLTGKATGEKGAEEARTEDPKLAELAREVEEKRRS